MTGAVTPGGEFRPTACRRFSSMGGIATISASSPTTSSMKRSASARRTNLLCRLGGPRPNGMQRGFKARRMTDARTLVGASDARRAFR